jgi:hypothetical protein
MELQSIRTDKITPAYMMAYEKWWRDTVGLLYEESREEAREGERNATRMYDPEKLESRIHRAKMDIVMRQAHAEFMKEYPWYQVELSDFWSAYVRHPLGWDMTRAPIRESENSGGEPFVNYFKEAFEEICAYDMKMEDNL